MKPRIFLVLCFIISINCISYMLVPERANITEISEKYLEFLRLYVTRASRKSPYYFNVEGQNKQTWGNNITLDLVFYEYLHNEYRRSFVEIHSRFCDLLEKDLFVGPMLKKRGAPCPAPANVYHLLNMTIPEIKFKVPFTKFRVEVILRQTDTNELIAKGFANCICKETPRNKTPL